MNPSDPTQEPLNADLKPNSQAETPQAQAGANASEVRRIEPMQPPLTLVHLRPCGGQIGSQPEDFVVDEIPLYRPSGEGEHLYLRVQKRSMTTQQLVDVISRVSGVSRRDIGCAGLKDKHAVTTQWLSLPRLSEQEARTWSLPADVQIVECSRHGNKLRTGHQAGNRFRITLVDVSCADDEVIGPLVDELQRDGLLNYYGRQRFGRSGESLQQALDWLRSGKRAPSRFLAKLYPSVIQAEVFNRYLSMRAARGLQTLVTGEVVRLNGSAKGFVVEDAARELPRLLAKDIHLTGPLPGPKMRAAEAEAAVLEHAASEQLGLGPHEWARLAKAAPGARRDLVVHPEHLSCSKLDSRSLVLEFTLPSGAYATQVVDEFTQLRPSIM